MAQTNNTRGQRVIRFIETRMIIPDGKLAGKPMILEKFQKDFIIDVYDNPAGTRKGILTTARKNGKTGLIAALMIVHLCGCEAKINTQIVSGASSREQAALVFDLASKIVNMSPRLRNLVKIIPSTRRMIGLPMNVTYKALAAEGKTAHGLSPVLAILDETGQVVGTKNDFIEAISSSQGAHDAPLLLVISTQAANDSDLLSVWIDDAIKSKDPKIVCHVHAAPPDCELLDENAWRMANPALDSFRSIDDLREQMIQASRIPSAEASARNLLLNQRISVNNPFISRSAWEEIKSALPPIEECSEVYGGLDLSMRTDLTALVLYGICDGKGYIYPHFWTPHIGLIDRAKRDRAPYDVWENQGFLKTTPSAVIEYDWLAHDIAEITSGINLRGIAFDRWRIDVLRKEFERIGLNLPLQEWGQGFKDMSPALDALESKILNKTMHHDGHPVLNMCAQNSMMIKNPAGDRKLDKMKTSGRIDGMVALAMAVGLAERNHILGGNIDDFLKNPLFI